MKQKIQNFKTKLKENKKFRAQFASVVTACVVVLACAITIPVCVHNSNVKKTQAVETESSTNDAISTEADTSTETTTEATTAETTTAETTTIEVTEPASNGSSGNNSSSSSNKGGSGNSGNSSSSKPTTTKPVTTTKKETTTEDDKWKWTQADVDATVAEVKRYAISKGFAIDSSLTEVGTSWMSPLDTRWDAKTRGVSDLEYQVDHLYNGIIQDFGYFPDGADLNVFSKNCGDYWEIYVVY